MTRAAGPDHVAVVGAGMAGLATAWFLQERGVRTTVLDRAGVAAGASWGNAGMLNPTLTVPLAEPGTLRAGLQGVLDPSSSITVPPQADMRLWRFLLQFARHSRRSRWRRSMQSFNELNRRSLDAYAHLTESGVTAPVKHRPLISAATSPAGLAPLVREIEEVVAVGGSARYEQIGADELHAMEPALSDRVEAGLLLHDQGYIDPPDYIAALADAVRDRGGRIVEDFDVSQVRDLGRDGVTLSSPAGHEVHADAAVIATGAWLNSLARRHGVRQVVQAGRGYSFTVRPDPMPRHPVHLPSQHLACNPLHDRFRITGTMELRDPDSPAEPRRIEAMVAAARPMFATVDWEARREEWVGSRPCTPDGLPLVGPTTSPRVHITGGHGMWGMVLGPVTGRLSADLITGAPVPAWASALNPLR